MNNLSQCWLRIQASLFPFLQEQLDPLSEKQQQLITVLEMARVEQFIDYRGIYAGRPLADRQAILRAFVAKAVYNMPTTAYLVDRLKNDKSLRRLCGWERRDEVPSESTFSRAFNECATSELPQRVHEALIQAYHSEHLVGHISRDATAIEAREKVCTEAKQRASEKKAKDKAKKAQGKTKRGRPKKGEERPMKDPTRLERQQTIDDSSRHVRRSAKRL